MFMSKMVGMAMGAWTRKKGDVGGRNLWALEMCPLSGDDVGNERILDILCEVMNETGLSVAGILNRDGRTRTGMLKYFSQDLRGRIPNYRQFLKMMDRLEDGGVFADKLCRYEEELLYQHELSRLQEIAGSGEARELSKTEFAMRHKLGSMLMKRRKDKGDIELSEAIKGSALRTLSNAQLMALDMVVEAKEKAKDVTDG